MGFQERLMTRKEVCESLGISVSTIRRWLEIGRLPQPIQISERRQLFKEDEIVRWLRECELERFQDAGDNRYDDATSRWEILGIELDFVYVSFA